MAFFVSFLNNSSASIHTYKLYFHDCPAKTCGRGKETLEKSGFVVPVGFNAEKRCWAYIPLASLSLRYGSASTSLLMSTHGVTGVLFCHLDINGLYHGTVLDCPRGWERLGFGTHFIRSLSGSTERPSPRHCGDLAAALVVLCLLLSTHSPERELQDFNIY